MPKFAAYGFARTELNFSIPMAGTGTGQFTVALSVPLGFKYTIEKVKAVWGVAGTGAGATRTLNVRKGTATGTVVATKALILADATQGAAVDVPVTAANANFEDGDNLTVEFAAAGTVYTAGEVNLVIQLRHRLQQSGA